MSPETGDYLFTEIIFSGRNGEPSGIHGVSLSLCGDGLFFPFIYFLNKPMSIVESLRTRPLRQRLFTFTQFIMEKIWSLIYLICSMSHDSAEF